MGRLLIGILRFLNTYTVSVIVVAAILFLGVLAKEQAAKVGEYKKTFGDAVAKVLTLEARAEEMRLGRDPFSIAYRHAKTAEEDVKLQIVQLEAAHPVKVHFPGTQAWQQRAQLEIQFKVLQTQTSFAEMTMQTQRRLIQSILEAARVEEAHARELFEKAREWEKALPYLWGAMVVVSIAIVARIAIKAFLYFFAAPWASRRPPIHLLPDLKGPIQASASWPIPTQVPGLPSAVSVAVTIDRSSELLIQNGHIQSASVASNKRTRWLFNWSIPYSSLLSGLYGLTCVQSEATETIMITASVGTLAEVSIIDLADGSGFVCHARSLIGVIQLRDQPIRITRHWRLGSLQSWLTLQLRSLVFHGPGQLLVEGGRGVRIESGQRPRLINQSATIGFSANLRYSNTRCETFLTYLSGKDELFNDSFAGSDGYYVYEEAPNRGRTNGLTGRGLEGLLDACLKAVGI